MEHFDQHSQRVNGAVVVRYPAASGAPGAYADVPAPYYAADAAEDSDSGGLLEYWHILRRNKKTLLLFAFVGVMTGLLVGLPMKPVYQVSTSLEVLSLNEDFMNMKQSNPVSNSDYSYDTSEEETQVKLLQSDALLEHVIEKLDPGRRPTPSQPLTASSGWRKLLNLPEPAQQTERQKLLSKLANSIKVRATPRTRVIEVTVKSTDPQLAVSFANTLANEFIGQNIEARWKTTQRVSDWLQRELNDERTKLERSEDALQAYARSSRLIFTDENTNVATEKLQQVQQQLTAVTADRISKESRYELAQHSSPDSLPDVLNDDGLRDSQAKITELRRQIADLSAVFTPDYSKVKRLQAELATTEAALLHDRENVIGRVNNDYQEALRKEKLLASAYDAQTREVTGQDEKAIQYNILKREVDSHRQLYDTMLQQMKHSSIASALHASNVRVIDAAQLPDKPVFPNFKTNSAVGLFSSLILGISLIIARERADRSLQQPGEAQLWTNLPELGTIPNASVDVEKNRNSPSQRTKGYLPTRLDGQKDVDETSIELITWNRKPSIMAEAFRSTLTSILFVGENGSSRPNVLVFTSANASDGKTTVATNLGIAMAEIRRNVLLIDADLRRPRVHEVFKLPNDKGLSDLLRAQTFSDDSVNACIHSTEVQGMHVLTSGPPTSAAANLLYSPNLAALLTKLKHQYDLIIIDTPPMLQMTDARVIGRSADAVVLVARAEQTTRDAILAASQRFSQDRIRVLGTILNDWNPKRSPGAYYGQYEAKYYTA